MISETFSAYAVNERNRAIQPEVLHAAKRCFIDWFSSTTAGGVKMPAISFQAAFGEDMDRGMARVVSPEVDLDVAQKLLDDIWRIEKCDNIQDLCIAPNR